MAGLVVAAWWGLGGTVAAAVLAAMSLLAMALGVRAAGEVDESAGEV
jgi:hypothetical protein